SNIFSNNVSVLLGNGDGTFQAAQFFGVGTGPALSAQSVAVGDFNGDGVPDLAVVNNGSNNVSVLINNTAHPSKTLTDSTEGIGSGTVTSGDGGIDCGPTCAASYTSGTVVTLTATPAFGSIFTHWRGCDMVSHRTCTVTMSAARSVTARFLGIPPPLF